MKFNVVIENIVKTKISSKTPETSSIGILENELITTTTNFVVKIIY